MLGKKYTLTYPFTIKYYSKKGSTLEENFAICQRIGEVLKVISVNNITLCGEDISFEALSDSLVFNISYEAFMEYEKDEYVNMEILNIKNL